MPTVNDAKKNIYFQILSILPNHFYWLDKNNRYLGCNNNQAIAFGLKNNLEVVGKTNRDFFNPGEADQLDETNLRVIREGKEIEIEEAVHFQGCQRTYLSKKTPLYDEKNNVIGLLGISFDITEKKLEEKIKRTQHVLKSRMRFISIASHETRGPMSNAISYLKHNQDIEKDLRSNTSRLRKLALREKSSPEMLDILQQMDQHLEKIFDNYNIVINESYRALNALKSLGDLYQLKTENIKEEPIFISIRTLIQHGISPFVDNSKQIRFSCEFDSTLSENTHVDASIDKALQIILSNAIRFSDEKDNVIITVQPLEGSYLAIKVKDQGEGISEQHLKNLFNSLLDDEGNEQDNHYAKPSIQLSIAKAYLEAIGGRLNFASMMNEGTTVTLEIPYWIKADTSNPSKKIFTKLNFLLIEDDPLTLSLEKQQLESLGHHVTTALSGEEAIDYLQHQRYDLVFVDITLPDKTGLEIVQTAQTFPQNMNTPYVAVTSHTSQQDKDYFLLENQFSAVINKPVSTEDFKKCIALVTEAFYETA